MKRIIMLLSLSLALLLTSQNVQAAKPHHTKHKVHIASATHPNIVKPTPRPEDEASVVAMMTDSDCDAQCVISDTSTYNRSMGTAYLCPSLDPSGMCDINTRFGALMNSIAVNPLAGSLIDNNVASPMAKGTLPNSSLTSVEAGSINNYYYARAVYEPPTTVTVGGFSVPVRGNPLYFSPFKHRDGAPLPVHNSKGVDETAGVGVSPRADGFPESIGSWPTYANTPPSR